MEITETEIKMFREAVEIQALRPDDGKWVDGDVWLSSQEQLQGMVCDTVEDVMLMPTHFYFGEQDWYHATAYALKFTTVRQLWLAFVMEEKYNKVWDGEKWVSLA